MIAQVLHLWSDVMKLFPLEGSSLGNWMGISHVIVHYLYFKNANVLEL